ncbi:hypothetical protein VTK73DRAFT_5568 [Phialemonium thermophilum]|uniref:Cytochrome b5 heme-binding domain-containing protein n=1 Tax=Phialemonium thermophilum TaxID=223376 RepID=A0ABR3XX21_9PEZI
MAQPTYLIGFFLGPAAYLSHDMDGASVAKHTSAQPRYIVIDFKVYDFTSFLNQQPGSAADLAWIRCPKILDCIEIYVNSRLHDSADILNAPCLLCHSLFTLSATGSLLYPYSEMLQA